jgi:hypothetical protein
MAVQGSAQEYIKVGPCSSRRRGFCQWNTHLRLRNVLQTNDTILKHAFRVLISQI